MDQEAPSLSLQPISGRESELSSLGLEGLGGHRGQRKGGSGGATLAPTARYKTGRRDPRTQGWGPATLPDPRGLLTLQVASKKAIRVSPRPLCLQGREPGAASEAPFLSLPRPDPQAAAQWVQPDSAGPSGHHHPPPLTPYSCPAPLQPRSRGRTDWLVLPASGKETPRDWPWVTGPKGGKRLPIGG